MISPSPVLSGSNILISELENGKPTLPGFFTYLFSAATAPDVSVKPYPWYISKPKSYNPWAVSLSSAAPPAIIDCKLGPMLSKICLNTFLYY